MNGKPSPSNQQIDTPPRIAVVIVTWNKKEYILALLTSLRAIDFPGWELFVVDNQSSDGTVEAIQADFPFVHCIVAPENLGGCGGFNTGLCAVLELGGFDYVWLLDNDVEVEPGALALLIHVLENHPDAALAGSHMLQLDFPSTTNEIGANVNLARGQLLLRCHETPEVLHGDEVYDVDYVAAASMLVRFCALQEVGIWDDLFIHYDDVDFCLRMKAAGWRVLACAGSRIYHLSAKSKRLTWVFYYDLRNILYLQNKYGGFGAWHFIKFFVLYAWFSVRDEWSGKTYYGQLAYRATRDFYLGKMGKANDLPILNTLSAETVLERIANEYGRHIMIKIPSSRPYFTDTQLALARKNKTTISIVCHERDEVRAGAPVGCPAILLSSGQLATGLRILKRILMQPKADYLIADIETALGPLGLCARNIVLMIDDKCVEIPGGHRAFIRSLKTLWRWIRLIPCALRLLSGQEKGRAFAAQSPDQFRAKLNALGGAAMVKAKSIV
jgi:GT2 family glycosyltransferase